MWPASVIELCKLSTGCAIRLQGIFWELHRVMFIRIHYQWKIDNNHLMITDDNILVTSCQLLQLEDIGMFTIAHSEELIDGKPTSYIMLTQFRVY